jgi:hypothetical protein
LSIHTHSPLAQTPPFRHLPKQADSLSLIIVISAQEYNSPLSVYLINCKVQFSQLKSSGSVTRFSSEISACLPHGNFPSLSALPSVGFTAIKYCSSSIPIIQISINVPFPILSLQNPFSSEVLETHRIGVLVIISEFPFGLPPQGN